MGYSIVIFTLVFVVRSLVGVAFCFVFAAFSEVGLISALVVFASAVCLIAWTFVFVSPTDLFPAFVEVRIRSCFQLAAIASVFVAETSVLVIGR